MTRLREAITFGVRPTAGELWSDGRGWIRVLVSAGWFLSRGTRTIYPALEPFFRTDFGISLTTAGILLSLLGGAYAIGQSPGGIFGDRYGAGTTLVASMAVMTAAAVLVTLSTTVSMLFLETVTFGFAAALYSPLRFTVFIDVYPDRAGTAVGVTSAIGNVANALLPVVAGALASYVTWRLGFGVLLPVFAGVVVAMWLVLPRRLSSRPSTVDDLSMRTVRRIGSGIRHGGIPTVFAIQILLSVLYQGFVGFHPTYLIEVKGFSPGVATTLFGSFFAIGIVVQPLGGWRGIASGGGSR